MKVSIKNEQVILLNIGIKAPSIRLPIKGK